jgi:hypothetical protein
VPSKAKTNFDENKADIDQLWSIHQDYAGKGAGRKHGVEVLNRAAIIFITAIWESFVEDLATEAFDFLLANAPNSTVIPSKVKVAATRPMFDQKDSRKVWDLADDGWRSILTSHKADALKRWLGEFNTPKTKQVNELYEELLGIVGLSKKWSWQKMSAIKAEKKLDEYLTIRGNIAHRVHHDTTVHKNWSADYLGHVVGLVQKCEEAVAAHLISVTGRQPW